MEAVLSGFTVIWLIIGVGYALGRLQVLGREARVVLSRVAFFVASPCLLFTAVAEASLTDVLGPQFAIAALGAFATGAVFMLLSIPVLRRRQGAERVVGGLSASLVNSANLGFPIAAYVLGDVAFAAPILVFQLALYTPVYVATLDFLAPSTGAARRVRPAPRIVLVQVAKTALNPMIIAALLGLLFSWQQWQFPQPVQESVEIVAGASIPLMLISFGLSLVGSRPLEKASGRRRDVLMASALKLTVHPLIAYAIAVWVFGMDGHQLLAAVVMAALPSAQNVLVAAIRYESGEIIARDTVLLTTVLAIPAMLVVSALLM
ncbi:AEC family transporter [Nesterenkonia aerolata]|uniref:AEC family transporter n=1 Tax=Nesterenkonia aerolata TaxID=3074079 RepID=A0ABU2DRN4_9MICC|nr:AEC family transporter [Nesterenkonia sp. LY-0111]MDR8019031.1 AEC family transporter [Nesterenkonia sp. LY-0111]